MQMQRTEPPPQTPISENGRDEKKDGYEAAARKVEVDEDYDDEAEEEKRKTGSGGRNSPQRATAAGPTTIQAEA